MTSDSNYVTVVSGLPRSGTSMMMRMLDEGGVPALSDRLRSPDIDNPEGYYEFERVKKLPDDAAWLPEAVGRSVKIIYKLVYELPEDYQYRVIFMLRDIEEVMASQNKMLRRSGIEVSSADTARFAALFRSDLERFRDWAAGRENMKLLYVPYRGVLEQPRRQAEAISRFLERPLDIEAMVGVIRPDLYRNRARTA